MELPPSPRLYIRPAIDKILAAADDARRLITPGCEMLAADLASRVHEAGHNYGDASWAVHRLITLGEFGWRPLPAAYDGRRTGIFGDYMVSLAKPSDGPVDSYRWRHDGEVINEQLQPAAWQMVNHLWQQPEKSATFDDLKIPVYADPEHEADVDAFGSLRRAANDFFNEHEIPWHVGIKKGVVSLTAAE